MKCLVIIILLSLPLLLSCQSNNSYSVTSNTSVSSLFLSQHFPKPTTFEIESEQEIFMLDDEMLEMVEKNLKSNLNIREKSLKLLRQIFSDEKNSLNYSTHANLTARQTYHSHKANCMSLTIMAYALAKAANLNVEFQQIDVPEYWVRNGQYNLLTGHVNLLIKPDVYHDRKIFFGNDNVEIDFDPYVVKQTFPKRVIAKNTVLAMFYNNKGGQALVDETYNIAYQYFKAALMSDKNFSPAWGNLAILYRLTNHIDIAEKTYRYAIQINPNNLTALTNLAILLRSQKNDLEAEKIESRLLLKRKTNPYYYAVLADEAYYKYDYLQALKYYKKAIKLNKKIHELYFGMAKVYYQMNRLPEAKRAIKRALILNKTKSTEYQYIAKLNFLKAETTN
ncbi:MAG: tetratricopeptide repeat protein [Colwellia sp.]|nr:tetratricopeptide repeat protein [Colwellia sp.]